MDDAAARSMLLFGIEEPPDDLDDLYPRAEDSLEMLSLPGGWSTFRRVVAEQVLADDPPETWVAAQRLMASGLDRGSAIDQLARGWYFGLAAALLERVRENDGSGSDALLAAVTAAFDELPLPDEDEVEDALVEAVALEQGIAADELVGRVAAAFDGGSGSATSTLVRHVLREALDDGETLGPLPGQRVANRSSLATSTVLTHRLTGDEIADGVLRQVAVDLCLFAHTYPVVGDVDEVEVVDDDGGGLAWRGPEGWLAAFAPGDVIAVRLDADERIAVERASDVGAADDIVASLLEAFDQVVGEFDMATPVGAVVATMVVDRPGLLSSPQPPITELFAEAGLELRDQFVGAAPAHWERLADQRRHDRLHEKTDDGDLAHLALDLLDDLDRVDATDDALRTALREIADDDTLAELVLDELVPPDGDTSPGAPVGSVTTVQRLVAAARRPREVAVASWIAAVADERVGDVMSAEARLVAGYAADPTFPPLVDRRAWYASDRGDPATAHRLWSSLDAVPIDGLEVIGRLLRRPGRQLGRNEPCWCGSGRKYKVCHQRRAERASLPERVPWLWYKAKSYLLHQRGDAKMTVVSNVVGLAGGNSEAMFGNAVHDPFVVDAALVEGGWFARFLDDRGLLLPEDEQLLAARWLLVPRTVCEVESVDAAHGIGVRDLRTGERVTVPAGSLPRDLPVGSRWCARAVPDGAGHQVVGGHFGVDDGREAEVLDLCDRGDPLELCVYIGASRAADGHA